MSTRQPKSHHGEGGVTQRADGRYMVRVTDPASGKRRTAYFATEPEAIRARRRMATRAEAGGVVLAKGATLRTWVEEWLPERAGRRRRPSTVRAYAYRLGTYVLPQIGGIKLRELSTLDIDDLVHDLARRGLSQQTIKGALIALSACLSDAKRGRLIELNPAVGVAVPERAKRTSRVVPPTVEQVTAVLAATKGTEVEALVMVLATTGVRIGEALACRWADLDLDRGFWTVARTTTVDEHGTVIVGERTKSGDERRVALPPETVATLRDQKRRVSQARLALGAAWDDHDLVFPSPTGRPQHSQNVRAIFRPLAQSVGWPGSFHAFRHFVATVGLSALPTAVVAKQLGHRRAALTTDVYGHLLDDDSAKIAALVSRLVSGEPDK